jgi:hypothetical protein
MSDSVVPTTAAPVSETPNQAAPEIKNTEHVDKFASKFAALTRKEKEASEKWKAKESEYASKLAEVEEKSKKYAPYEELDKNITSNKRKALDFMRQKGVTMDELQEWLIEESNPDPEMRFKRSVSETESKLMKEIQALKESLEEKDTKKKQSEEEEAKKQHEKVVQGVMADLTEFVNKNEDYELIRSYNSVDMVYQVMNEHYMEQVNKGMPDQLIKILSYKDACDAVEAHLDDQVKKVYEAKRAKQAPKKEEAIERKATQTLSNTQSSEVPSSGERNLSKEERIKEAAKHLRWNG